VNLLKQHLTNTFAKARETGASCVFIEISAIGVDEIVLVPKRSFDAKERFYDKAYSDDLTHVMNSDVFIRGLSYGEIEDLHNII
jgi:hypothetical protein